MTFKEQILQGIPDDLPAVKQLDPSVSHAPKRKDILSLEEKKLAIKNALRYFHPKHRFRITWHRWRPASKRGER